MSGFNKDNFFTPQDDTTIFEANPDLLFNTPSRADGIDERTETMMRVYGCELIQEAGILLRMHQTAIVTGQIIFHRFYYRISMKRCDVRGVAKAAILLGGKIEEQPRKLHDILNVFHAGALRRHSRKVEPLVSGTKRYFELKEDILNAEQAILRELGLSLPPCACPPPLHSILLLPAPHSHPLLQPRSLFPSPQACTFPCVRCATLVLLPATHAMHVSRAISPHPFVVPVLSTQRWCGQQMLLETWRSTGGLLTFWRLFGCVCDCAASSTRNMRTSLSSTIFVFCLPKDSTSSTQSWLKKRGIMPMICTARRCASSIAPMCWHAPPFFWQAKT